MTLVRSFRAVLAAGVMLAASAIAIPEGQAATDPAGFIQELGDQAIKIIADKSLNQGTRREQFGKLFTASFDVPAIGRFVLGRYWRTATPQQQTDYLKLFGAYVVSVYSERFANYSGEKFKVLGSRKEDDSASTVSSEIERPNGGPPIHIDWRVVKGAEGFKITDVIVENLSMAVTQRSEFASIIDRGGGNIDGLLDLLRKKVSAG
jgi:phospholipid transport system substrate-binding protein